MKPKTTAALLVVALLPAVGCGSRGPELGQVGGRVTLDGAPLAEAAIMFVPEEGRPATAHTGPDGEFILRFTPGRLGALLGPHAVRITTAKPAREDIADDGTMIQVPARAERVPAAYNNASELRVDVQPGKNTFVFELRSE